MYFPTMRMRRLRKNSRIREIIRETKVCREDLIYPIFFKDSLKKGEKEEITSMPGEYRYSLDEGVRFAKKLESQGLKSIIVFGLPYNDQKDEIGTPAYMENGIVQKAIRSLKKETNLVIISDVCLCQYSSHGHCGIIREDESADFGYEILNDETLNYLSKVALSHAEAGADIIAPSDMMDGRVEAIRTTLDENGYENVMIMSYSAKYASAFYEPFRQAADSSPVKGNRKTYQMDPANATEAIRECELDLFEGADFLIIKPALPYLDIIKTIKEQFNLPIVSYNVSGEYSMIMSAIEKGFLKENAIIESLISIKRAGSDLIITNFAPYILENNLLD